MATSNQVLKKMCGDNQAQPLLEKHHALGNCFKRKEKLFWAKKGSSDQNWAKIKKSKSDDERKKEERRRKFFFFINVRSLSGIQTRVVSHSKEKWISTVKSNAHLFSGRKVISLQICFLWLLCPFGHRATFEHTRQLRDALWLNCISASKKNWQAWEVTNMCIESEAGN